LKTYRWSLSVNGKKLVKNMQFPETYRNEFKNFFVMEFQWYGGSPKWAWNDPLPAPDKESKYALGKVKLVKVSN
jgi:hypothetical protein